MEPFHLDKVAEERLLPPPPKPLVLDENVPVYKQLPPEKRRWFETNLTALLDATHLPVWASALDDYRQAYGPAEPVPEKRRAMCARLLVYQEVEEQVLFARDMAQVGRCGAGRFEHLLVELQPHKRRLHESTLVHSDPTLHQGYYVDQVRQLMYACCHRPVPSPGCFTPLILGQEPGRVYEYRVLLHNYWADHRLPTLQEVRADIQVGTAYKDTERYQRLDTQIRAAWYNVAPIIVDAYKRYRDRLQQDIDLDQPRLLYPQTLLTADEREALVNVLVMVDKFNYRPTLGSAPLRTYNLDETIFHVDSALAHFTEERYSGVELPGTDVRVKRLINGTAAEYKAMMDTIDNSETDDARFVELAEMISAFYKQVNLLEQREARLQGLQRAIDLYGTIDSRTTALASPIFADALAAVQGYVDERKAVEANRAIVTRTTDNVNKYLKNMAPLPVPDKFIGQRLTDKDAKAFENATRTMHAFDRALDRLPNASQADQDKIATYNDVYNLYTQMRQANLITKDIDVAPVFELVQYSREAQALASLDPSNAPLQLLIGAHRKLYQEAEAKVEQATSVTLVEVDKVQDKAKQQANQIVALVKAKKPSTDKILEAVARLEALYNYPQMLLVADALRALKEAPNKDKDWYKALGQLVASPTRENANEVLEYYSLERAKVDLEYLGNDKNTDIDGMRARLLRLLEPDFRNLERKQTLQTFYDALQLIQNVLPETSNVMPTTRWMLVIWKEGFRRIDYTKQGTDFERNTGKTMDKIRRLIKLNNQNYNDFNEYRNTIEPTTTIPFELAERINKLAERPKGNVPFFTPDGNIVTSFPPNMAREPFVKTWDAFFAVLLDANNQQKKKAFYATLDEYKAAYDKAVEKAVSRQKEEQQVVVAVPGQPSGPVNFTIDVEEPPLLYNGNNLFNFTTQAWEGNSCWLDVAFLTLFKMPRNALSRYMFAKKQFDISKLGPNCTADDLVAFHKTVLSDIAYIQRNENETEQCLLSRLHWDSTQNSCIIKDDAVATGDFASVSKALRLLQKVYQLGARIVQADHSIGDGRVVPGNSIFDRKIVTSETEYLFVDTIAYKYENRVSFRTWMPEEEITVQEHSFLLYGIISASVNHFIVHLYDHKSEKWAIFDPYNKKKKRGWLRTLNASVHNFDTGIDIGGVVFKPSLYVYVSAVDIERLIKESGKTDRMSDVFRTANITIVQEALQDDNRSIRQAAQGTVVAYNAGLADDATHVALAKEAVQSGAVTELDILLSVARLSPLRVALEPLLDPDQLEPPRLDTEPPLDTDEL